MDLINLMFPFVFYLIVDKVDLDFIIKYMKILLNQLKVEFVIRIKIIVLDLTSIKLS